MKKERECRICEDVKPFKDFGPAVDRVVKAACTECRVTEGRNRTREKSMLKNPDKFNQCNNDGCCFIWKKNLGDYCSVCGELVIGDCIINNQKEMAT